MHKFICFPLNHMHSEYVNKHQAQCVLKLSRPSVMYHLHSLMQYFSFGLDWTAR